MSIDRHIIKSYLTRIFIGFVVGCNVLAATNVLAQEAETSKKPSDAEVPAYKLPAIDFINSPSMIAKDDKIARAPVIFIHDLPFPHTSRPVTTYIRVRSSSIKDEFIATSEEARERGEAKRLATVSPQTVGDWQWVRLQALTFAQVGGRLRIDARADKAVGRPVEVDSIVLSTRSDLDDAALAKTPLLFPNGPVVRVGKTTTPPIIDGRNDDDAWKTAVTISDFMTYNALRPAKESTAVCLMHNDKNLYVLFRNSESLLKTADMRGDELKTLAKTRDGEVINGKLAHDVLADDSCLLMLQPHADGPVYEFTVNARGTMADARMERKDLWATRDLSWNSHFKAVARQGEGRWTLEMEIPLADIGATPLQAGDHWQAVLMRNAAGRKETTSWNPSGTGAHSPLEMGTLVFDMPGVTVSPDVPFQGLQPGLNKITTQIAPSTPTDIAVISKIQAEGANTAIKTSYFPAQNKSTAARHEFQVAPAQAATARWGAFDAATMQPIYLSPAIRMDVQSMSIALKLATPGAYELVVNDQVLAQGDKAIKREVQLPLRAGANVIALRADTGIATLALDAPGLERFDAVWHANNAATLQATSSSLDDRKWPVVKADATSTFTGQGPTVFRRTILVNQTPVWPVPQPAIYIAGKSVQHVSFIVRGLPEKVQDNWTTYLAVPKELQVLGSTGFYGTTSKNQPQFSCERAGETTIEGQVLPLYKITADKPLLNNRNAIRSIFQVMLKIADESQAKEGVSWKLHYWSQANGGTMIEAPRSFEMRALPPLNGHQLKKLNWELWGSYFHAMDNEALRLATLETMQNAGFNHVMAGNRWTSDAGSQYGIGNSKMIGFQPWTIDLIPYLKEHSTERLVDRNGKPQDGSMCTTLLAEQRWPVVAPILAALLKKDNPASVTYDYEFSPLTGPHSCYCERCLAAFRERAHLDANVTLTPRIIEDRYLAPWQDFMAYRAAQILAKMKETTHATLPGVPFNVYSLFQSPRTLAVYGIDWRYIGRLKAVDIAQAGLLRPLDDIRATYEALDGIPLMMGVWMTPYDPDDLSPARNTSKAELLRRTLDSTAGMLVYDRNPLDGRSWTAIAETTRLLSQYEDMFIAHQLADLPGQDSARVQLLKGGETSLVCLLNETGRPAEFDFQVPVELGAGHEFYSGQALTAGGRVQMTLAPGDTAVYVLHK